MTTRREFLGKACGLCGAVLGIGIVLPALQSCSSILTVEKEATDGFLEVDRSAFNEENKIILIESPALEFDVALVQLSEETFKALKMECTHFSNPLVATKNGFVCNTHGSSFRKDGSVRTSPAERNLQEYPIELNSNTIKIII